MEQARVFTDDDFDKIEVIVNERRRDLESDTVSVYLREHSLRQTPQQQQLINETRNLGFQTYIQMSEPEEMQLVANLIRTSGSSHVIEVGSLTGYSALTMALALPDNGRVIACDINDLCLSVGQKHWQAAGVDHKIQLRLGPAETTLENIVRDQGPGSYDLVYIDADKNNYDTYYELALKLVRQKGLIIISNIYYYGMLEDARFQDSWTCALRQLNRKLKEDERVDVSMLQLGDGLALLVKR